MYCDLYSTVMETFRCKLCNIQFKSKRCLTAHKKSQRHIKHMTNENSFKHKCGCGKSYEHRQSLFHHRKSCMNSLRKETETEKEDEVASLKIEMEELKEELKQLKAEKSVTNTTNNNTNIETQNITINLNAHGCENLDYLGKADLIDSIHHVFKSVPNLISKIYFNPEHPENHNVKITDRRSPYISVYTKEKKWKFFNKRDTVGNMIDTSLMMLDDTFMDNKSCLPVPVRDGFQRLQKAYEKNDNKTMKKNINKEVDMVIMNGPN